MGWKRSGFTQDFKQVEINAGLDILARKRFMLGAVEVIIGGRVHTRLYRPGAMIPFGSSIDLRSAAVCQNESSGSTISSISSTPTR